MCLKQCHKLSPVISIFHRWYGYHSQSGLVYESVLLTLYLQWWLNIDKSETKPVISVHVSSSLSVFSLLGDSRTNNIAQRVCVCVYSLHVYIYIYLYTYHYISLYVHMYSMLIHIYIYIYIHIHIQLICTYQMYDYIYILFMFIHVCALTLIVK